MSACGACNPVVDVRIDTREPLYLARTLGEKKMYKSPPHSEMLYCVSLQWLQSSIQGRVGWFSGGIFVQAGIHDSFLERFKHETIQNIRPGPLDNEKTTLGCLITSKAVKKITELVSDAESKGAKAVLGGKRDNIDPETFHSSTILKDMTSDMQGSQTELFGPVATVYKFDSEQ
ncbi:Succinate-semialdehyde dehydrogenase, mitochondrial [Exophiala xenobiotica]|nr:Succinate-semialdehyde dehydrogenase, mitochondrial [Exophiala xenobiotica]KAK5236423.1 Succinate-semialdehyde dehydrogenase, mitochondrial [Exophiala xenobiotica]KAK5241584.1 Succinate-semialdehyde dehydrogenase, mitochondrial [Exophiala xenobiotica]KAK5281237.1 hypothetical protein LTR40_005167 [Exophiala xenobiotica]KAK5350534.1 Succinate-semialdehyde dehydrogenase, mitochondrial [Exophiala xenobiotica]